MFHLNNVCAAGKVALAHEALGTMFAACLHYQVDLLGGDANMAMYRATGRKQESVDIRGSYVRTNPSWVTSSRRGPKLHKVHICASPEYSTFPQTACADWSTFPGLDPMVATVFEWGHSMDDEQWSMIPSSIQEFKGDCFRMAPQLHKCSLPPQRPGLTLTLHFSSRFMRTNIREAG